MKKALLLIVASGVVFLSAFLIARRVYSQSDEKNPGVAFTALVLERQLKADGTDAHQETVLYARRADGSEIELAQRRDPNGGPFGSTKIVDIPGKRIVVVDPLTESLITYPLSEDQLRFYADRRTKCAPSAEAQHGQRLGYKVVRVSRETTLSASLAVRTERWLAPELGCFPLEESTSFSSGPKTLRQVSSIFVGEPSASLFAVPANFVERSPAELAAEFAKRYPGRKAFAEDALSKLQAVYRSNR